MPAYDYDSRNPSASSHPPARTPSPHSPDWVDVLAPHQEGLPVYLARPPPSSGRPMSAVEVVDSSAARRRGGGTAYEEPSSAAQDAYDGGKGEKEAAWTQSSGIGMESRYPPPPEAPTGRREFAAGGKAKDGKWSKLIPEKREPQSWVSPFAGWEGGRRAAGAASASAQLLSLGRRANSLPSLRLADLTSQGCRQ